MTDYDRTEIPAVYDRARDHGPEVLDLWTRTVEVLLDGRSIARILDLGCGTGRFSEGLAAQFDAEVIGLDPSSKMLEIARRKQRDPRVRYEIGRAEAIPLGDESVDLIFMSMSLHHFTDQAAAARECRRVLSPAGSVMIRTGTREQIASYPYSPFFPASMPLMEDTLPSREDVRATFAAAGLEVADWKLVPQTIAPDWATYAEKLAAGGDSILARLSRQDFEAGLAAVRRYGVAEGREPVVEQVDLFVLSVAATHPNPGVP
ncbi:MAG TPA: class I SAM-dependent methyltransferase [Gemmatimonadaceae bacterium]|jgi:ubiquinone/menaquinone biosynthesis C-methylase UbiE|nr:class I SAM-dependent methyltransferase [Gemmatimonadaceae bacterium]